MTIVKFRGHMRPDAVDRTADRETRRVRAAHDARGQGRLECPTPTACLVPTTNLGRILARLRGLL